MTTFIQPKLSEDQERWGLGFDDPGPASLPKMRFEPNRARLIESRMPNPGLSQQELDRKLDGSVARARLRQRDFFSIPAADNRIELAMKSWPGARNDIKTRIPGSEKFGNFLFGAEAGAGGISEREALFWGRLAQVAQDVFLDHKWPTGKDNSGDADEIRKGYQYFQQRKVKGR